MSSFKRICDNESSNLYLSLKNLKHKIIINKFAFVLTFSSSFLIFFKIISGLFFSLSKISDKSYISLWLKFFFLEKSLLILSKLKSDKRFKIAGFS